MTSVARVERPGEAPHRLRNEALRAGADLDIEVEIVPVEKEFFSLVTHPKFGHGANMNPCIDCRIFMLKKAKGRMDALGARFVFTGEVLGQRPMSQHLFALRTIEREAGLEGLPPAAPLGPAPARDHPREAGLGGSGTAAGHLGTIPAGVSWRWRKFWTSASFPSLPAAVALSRTRPSRAGSGMSWPIRCPSSRAPEDSVLLKVGRHFRVSHQVKVVVGRDEAENVFLARHLAGRWWFEVPDAGSPLVLVQGDPDPPLRRFIAGITARYSSQQGREGSGGRGDPGRNQERLRVAPLTDEALEPHRICAGWATRATMAAAVSVPRVGGFFTGRGVNSAGECYPHTVEVAGSNPARPTNPPSVSLITPYTSSSRTRHALYRRSRRTAPFDVLETSKISFSQPLLPRMDVRAFITIPDSAPTRTSASSTKTMCWSRSTPSSSAP